MTPRQPETEPSGGSTGGGLPSDASSSSSSGGNAPMNKGESGPPQAPPQCRRPRRDSLVSEASSSNDSGDVHDNYAGTAAAPPAAAPPAALDPNGRRLRFARMGSNPHNSMRSIQGKSLRSIVPPPPSGPSDVHTIPKTVVGRTNFNGTRTRNLGGDSSLGQISLGSLGPVIDEDDATSSSAAPRDLHAELCAACMTCPSLTELREVLHGCIVVGGQTDICSKSEQDSGRLPLHFIGLNRDLILFSTGGAAASIARVDEFILRELLPEHPSAIIHEDEEGRIPFTEVILKWIRARRAARTYQIAARQKMAERDRNASVATKIARRLSLASTGTGGGGDESDGEDSLNIDGLSVGNNSNMSLVCGADDGDVGDDEVHDLPPLVEWSLRMLSTIIDRPTAKNQLGCSDSNVKLRTEQMGGGGARRGSGGSMMSRSVRNLTVEQGHDSLDSSTALEVGSTAPGRMRRGAARRRRRSSNPGGGAPMQTAFIYDEIVVEKVASIPHLVEELLLIKDRSARTRVFGLSIVHKVLFSPSSLGDGKWFIDMLTRGIGVNNSAAEPAPASNGGGGQEVDRGIPSLGSGSSSKGGEHKPNASSAAPPRTALHRTNSMQRAASLLGTPTLRRTGSVVLGGLADSEDESGVYAEASVFYLEAISHLHLQDDLDVLHHMQMLKGGASQPRGGNLMDMVGGSDLRHFRRKRDKLYDAVAGLDGLIRFICVLDDDLLSRAAMTPVIQRKLDKKIFSPFSLTNAFFDGIVHVLLVVSFRLGPAPALFHLSPIDASFKPQQYLISCMVLVLCLTHFALKEVHLSLAKYALSKRLFWSDALTFWNLLDIVPLFMAAFSLIAVDYALRQRALVSSQDTTIPFYLRVAVASTTPFLWLRLLGHIKMWNKQLATFILCSVEIMKDIKWFMLVLLACLASFAQMWVSLTFEPSAAEGDVQPDQYQYFSFEGYLKAYTIMLGDFDALSMQEHPSITLLFIFYTFGVTIVLLNVLIAIVSDSYANASVSSKTMLGKARVMFLAELSSLKNFHRMWSRGELGSLERNINLAAMAFGALTTKLLVGTVKAKLSRTGKTSIFIAEGAQDTRQLDVEAWLLFVLFSSVFYVFKITMIHIQQAFDERGLGLSAGKDDAKGKGAAASQSDKWTIDFYVERICNFVTRGVDALTEDDDTKLLEESAESASGETANGNTEAFLNKLQRSMNANRKEFKSELKHTADKLQHALEESEHHTQGDMHELEEHLTSALAENQESIAAMIAASEERMLQAILHKLENGKGGAGSNMARE